MYCIETNKGFDHGYCWWGNINLQELITFDSYSKAEAYMKEVIEPMPEVKWAKVVSV